MADDIEFNSGDRDQVVKQLIRHDDSHLGSATTNRQLTYWSETEFKSVHPDRDYVYWSEFNRNQSNDTSISLVVAPSWGVIFPPYNLARLTGLLRHYGYTVRNYDTNIESWHYVKNIQDKDWWDSIYFYAWEDPVYSQEIHPVIKPVLDKHINQIVDSDHDIIGFSLYQSNLMASMYMMKEVKRLKPTVRILIGGPEAFNSWLLEKIEREFNFPISIIDFIVQGEGEQELLTLLENLDEFAPRNDPYVFGGFQSRLDLDDLPFPDYDDFNFSLYEHPDGASIETSRGCVAKCSFCAETHFWKFRHQQSSRVIEEMKYQIARYGVKRFWFVDSLANGAFTEFKNLVNGIIDEGLDIRWNSYARNDGRMDLELFQKIKNSGCTVLSFGVESGSQRVLDDMQKKVKVWEIEANLRDGKAVGMTNHCNWIVGFPTEGKLEFVHSLELLYNVRRDMYAISPGYTCGDAPFSDMQKNWRKYGIAWENEIADQKFLSNWYTDNYANTIVHRYIRLKLTNIWLDLITSRADGTVINTQARPSLRDSYSVNWIDTNTVCKDRVEQLDHNFVYFNNNTADINFSADLADEYIGFAWLAYTAMGAFELQLTIGPEQDLDEFGTFVVNDYTADVFIRVNAQGLAVIKIEHSFRHRSLIDDDDVEKIEHARKDMSFDTVAYEYRGPISKFNPSTDK